MVNNDDYEVGGHTVVVPTTRNTSNVRTVGGWYRGCTVRMLLMYCGSILPNTTSTYCTMMDTTVPQSTVGQRTKKCTALQVLLHVQCVAHKL